MPGEELANVAHAEAEQHIASGEPEWRGVYDADTHYYLYIVSGGLDECSYTYTARYAPRTNVANGLQIIPHGDVKWFMDFVLANAKVILSHIRGKFEGITGPEGEQPIDWSRLRDDAETSMEKLIEDIKQRQRPLPPVIG